MCEETRRRQPAGLVSLLFGFGLAAVLGRPALQRLGGRRRLGSRIRLGAGMPDGGLGIRRLRVGAAASGFAATRDRLPRLPRGALTVGIGRDRRDQRRAAAGRTGIDHDRLRRRGIGREPFRRLRHRRLAGRRRETSCRWRRPRRWSMPTNRPRADDQRIVVVAGRLVVLAAAHFVAQVRRRGVDRRELSTVPSEGLSHARPLLEAKPRSSSCAARTARMVPEEAPSTTAISRLSVARGGGHEIVAGGADEAGLETVGAGIASDQPVEVLRDPRAEADRGDVDEIFVFRQVLDDGARRIARSRAEVIWPSAGRPFGLT